MSAEPLDIMGIVGSDELIMDSGLGLLINPFDTPHPKPLFAKHSDEMQLKRNRPADPLIGAVRL